MYNVIKSRIVVNTYTLNESSTRLFGFDDARWISAQVYAGFKYFPLTKHNLKDTVARIPGRCRIHALQLRLTKTIRRRRIDVGAR